MKDPVADALAERANQLLGDGEWHSYDWLVRSLMPVVPKGRAIRQNERDRITSLGSNKPRKKQITVEEQINHGQRSVTRAWLNRKVALEFRGEPRTPEREVRLVGILRSGAGGEGMRQGRLAMLEAVRLRDLLEEALNALEANRAAHIARKLRAQLEDLREELDSR